MEYVGLMYITLCHEQFHTNAIQSESEILVI